MEKRHVIINDVSRKVFSRDYGDCQPHVDPLLLKNLILRVVDVEEGNMEALTNVVVMVGVDGSLTFYDGISLKANGLSDVAKKFVIEPELLDALQDMVNDAIEMRNACIENEKRWSGENED